MVRCRRGVRKVCVLPAACGCVRMPARPPRALPRALDHDSWPDVPATVGRVRRLRVPYTSACPPGGLPSWLCDWHAVRLQLCALRLPFRLADYTAKAKAEPE